MAKPIVNAEVSWRLLSQIQPGIQKGLAEVLDRFVRSYLFGEDDTRVFKWDSRGLAVEAL